MIDCKVKNWEGKAINQAQLDLKVAPAENASHIIHRALVRHRANARQGNASTKTRSEVRGGGRKPWRKKERDVLVRGLFVLHYGEVVVLFLVLNLVTIAKK